MLFHDVEICIILSEASAMLRFTSHAEHARVPVDHGYATTLSVTLLLGLFKIQMPALNSKRGSASQLDHRIRNGYRHAVYRRAAFTQCLFNNFRNRFSSKYLLKATRLRLVQLCTA